MLAPVEPTTTVLPAPATNPDCGAIAITLYEVTVGATSSSSLSVTPVMLPPHTISVYEVITGSGLMFIVILIGSPLQPNALIGVTVYTTCNGPDVRFV